MAMKCLATAAVVGAILGTLLFGVFLLWAAVCDKGEMTDETIGEGEDSDDEGEEDFDDEDVR